MQISVLTSLSETGGRSPVDATVDNLAQLRDEGFCRVWLTQMPNEPDLLTVLALAAAPAAYGEEGPWGAIAVSPDGKSVGLATNQPNEYLANTAANADCQQNSPICNVLITFKHPDCGAVVEHDDHYFGDSGPTQQEAEQNAMNQSPGGTVLRGACNNPSEETDNTPTSTGATPPSTSTTAPGG
jgi:hypothetical protein